jgi:hypothetical protein
MSAPAERSISSKNIKVFIALPLTVSRGRKGGNSCSAKSVGAFKKLLIPYGSERSMRFTQITLFIIREKGQNSPSSTKTQGNQHLGHRSLLKSFADNCSYQNPDGYSTSDVATGLFFGPSVIDFHNGE